MEYVARRDESVGSELDEEAVDVFLSAPTLEKSDHCYRLSTTRIRPYLQVSIPQR